MKKLLLSLLFFSIQSYAYFTDGVYNININQNINLKFKISNNSTIIDSVSVIFKNYLPPNNCGIQTPLNGPFSGGAGMVSNNACYLKIYIQAPRIILSFESWCSDNNFIFNYKTLIVLDGCILNPVIGQFPSNPPSTGGFDGDDDDDSNPTDSDKYGTEGDSRIDSGANSPNPLIIGLDVQINPEIVKYDFFKQKYFTNAIVNFIISNDRYFKIDIDKLEIIGLDKLNLEIESIKEIIPDKQYNLLLSGNPNVLNGNYDLTFIYDNKFISNEFIVIQNNIYGANQAFILPPPERKLFHRGVIY